MSECEVYYSLSNCLDKNTKVNSRISYITQESNVVCCHCMREISFQSVLIVAYIGLLGVTKSRELFTHHESIVSQSNDGKA